MKVTEYSMTFVLATIVLLLTVRQGGATYLVSLIPFFLVSVIYNVIRILRKPDERKRCCIRLAIWSLIFALAGTVQIYWSKAMHNDVASTVKTVLAHKDRTGNYPVSLQEVGLNDKYLQDKWGLRYSIAQGKPVLVYPAPIIPLTMYEYDFQTHNWRKNAY